MLNVSEVPFCRLSEAAEAQTDVTLLLSRASSGLPSAWTAVALTRHHLNPDAGRSRGRAPESSDLRYNTKSQIHLHTLAFVYGPLYLSSNVRVSKTVVWGRLHLLCVLDRTKEASSHAQMLLLKPAFQSLQKPRRIKCVNFFIFVQFLTDFC